LAQLLQKRGQMMHTKSVTVRQFCRQLHAVLRDVGDGTAITITRHGEPVAVMVSPAAYDSLRGREESQGWPAGYFEQTYGVLAEDTLERSPQEEEVRQIE